ncbi:uncharacterized protein A1O9_12790 [Exophiala aquamarina CBS 119918]|uniref:Uncharacterized protein n=1 Tax=Exophiala aquamarina CBS 119918 TaxID=1182545 RepID=A0A072NU73_9EURO|nr:uncharacterized protein A1O9_12790 [Exophiala aquamarina CBS 119918]KEF51176.1 hypothetical protein A1O9_12790 [Exophiala aquamarina CBS 119918]
MQIASKVSFAAHALIVISAKRLAHVTKEAGILDDAAKHHALAVQGLRKELATFSRENADAVLCGSILLLFQQDTW